MKSLIFFIVSSIFMAPLFGGIEYSATASALGMVVGSMIPTKGMAFNVIIPIQDARALFTKKLIAVYKQNNPVYGFLRSFFEPVESFTKHVSIEVQHSDEKVAVDVYRHSGGTRETFDKYTEETILPPYFELFLTLNEHRLYDQVISAMAIGQGDALFAQMTIEQAEKLFKMQQKIERAVEKMAKQVFETGVITLNNGTKIDYRRQAESLVDKGAGNYWATGTVSPFKDMEAGCKFLREEGKAHGAIFNAILGSEALEDFLNNTIVQDRGDIKSFDLDTVVAPIRNAQGASMHGIVSCGSYKVRLWSYPQIFEEQNGTRVEYVDPKLCIILPEGRIGKESYSAVPQLIKNGGIPQKGRFLVEDFLDEENTAHKARIKSAPVIVPVKVNQIYTVKVVA